MCRLISLALLWMWTGCECIWWLRMCFDWVLNCPQSLALRPLFSSTPSTKCLFNGKIICTLRHRRVSEIVIFISSNGWVNRPGSSDEWRTQCDCFRLRNYFSICNGRHSVRVCCHSSNGLNEQMSDFHVKINTCARNFDPSGACCMFTDYNQHLRFHSSFFCFFSCEPQQNQNSTVFVADLRNASPKDIPKNCIKCSQ